MALTAWLSDPKDRLLFKEGDRIDILWENGNTSAHDFAIRIPTKELGFWLNHHETKIWVPIASVKGFRKIPGGKRRPLDPKPRPRNPNRGM